MEVIVTPWLEAETVAVVNGQVLTGSMSGLLAQIERDRRRDDCLAVWPPIRDVVWPAVGYSEIDKEFAHLRRIWYQRSIWDEFSHSGITPELHTQKYLGKDLTR